MYTIAYDAQARLLTIGLRGFWTKATQMRFLAEAGARAIGLLVRHGRYGVLVDLTDYPIQDGTIVDGFAGLIGRAHNRGMPVCLLCGSTLCKMQAERVLGSTGIEIFRDGASARSWLADRIHAMNQPKAI